MRGVLLDLDGTLADTAPDLGGVLNLLRGEHNLPPMPLRELRAHVSAGARGMLACGLDMTPQHPEYMATRARFLELYGARLAQGTRLFDGMAGVLGALRQAGIRWGVVTNKPRLYAAPLLAALDLVPDGDCLVTPDDVRAPKPDPEGVHQACARLGLAAAETVFVGDDARDIAAGDAAGTRTIAALWGYLLPGDPPVRWGATALLAHPAGLPALLSRWGS